MPPVSVVIAVHNDPTGLSETLEALERQSFAADRFEVIVVDDASTDATPLVAGRFPFAKLLVNERQGGSYVSRNRALAEATGDVVAVTDAGCVPAPTWLERGFAAVDRGRSSVVAGRIAMPLGDRPTLAAMVDVIHHLDQARSVEHGHAVTANLWAARSTFELVGGFDERLRSGGDVDWTRRAVAAGCALVYADDVVVEHAPRDTVRALLKKSRRVARGGSERRAGRSLPWRARPYLQLSVLTPRHRRRGLQRVRENGGRPGRLRWLAVGVMQVLSVQLAQAAYALADDLRRALLGRGASRD